MTIDVINPNNGKIIKHFNEYTNQEVEQKLSQAENTFNKWKNLGFSEKSKLLNIAGKVLRENSKKYAEIISIEMGKPITEALAEVEKSALVCDFYAINAEKFLSKRTVQTDGKISYIQYNPLGQVLAIMPWNFPFWQVFRFAAPALMAGNVCVLKHASNVPESALSIESVFKNAGYPDGAFTTLLISSGNTEKVIRDKRIRAVTLTGSEFAGSKVASIAGEVLKKTVLELGGSDPFIVLKDANIKEAATQAAKARNINTGQSCIAAKRFIVEKDVAEEFIEYFKNNLKNLKLGNPLSLDTQIGPMARSDLRDELHSIVTRSVAMGAKIELGGEIPKTDGYFYPVTLLTNVTKDMPVMKEETFGPVAPIIIVDNESEALEIANSSQYGLGASLWCSDLKKAQTLATQIESGSVFINGMVKSDPRLPFGGIKLSGYGRELSEEGIREFVNIKTVWIGA